MKVASNVRQPPDPLVQQFREPIIRLLRTWLTVARSVPDLEITSWFRDPAYNASVRKAQPYSQHTVGCAMDAKSRSLGQAGLAAIAARAAKAHGTTMLTSEGTAVHVQALPTGYVRSWALRNPTLYGSASAFVGPLRPLV